MGYKVILDVGNRYTGCRELIPGSVYLDNKGNKILFVGFGNFKITPNRNYHNKFIYLKVDQIERKINKGLLSADLKEYYGGDICADMLFYISEKPRLLKSFVCEMFPSDYFEHFINTQYVGGFNLSTEVMVYPVAIPHVCKVQRS